MSGRLTEGCTFSILSDTPEPTHTCFECGAVVPENYHQAHYEWHTQLARIVNRSAEDADALRGRS